MALYILGIYQVLQNIVENVAALFQRQQQRGKKDLIGKVALVTGASRGIGKHIALELIQRGCYVILACRNRVDAAGMVAHEMSCGLATIVDIDLCSFKSVLACIRQLESKTIDYVICNAGIMAPSRHELTYDGFEMQMQVNCLSHILLVHSLLCHGNMRNSSSSRIMFVSSFAHIGSSLSSSQDMVNSLTCASGYSPKLQYANTKLLDILAASSLHKRMLLDYSMASSSCSINPGVVDTDLARHFCRNEFPFWIRWLTDIILDFMFFMALRRPQSAARGIVKALTMPAAVTGGKYLTIGPLGYVNCSSSPNDHALHCCFRNGIFYELLQRIQQQDKY